MLPNYEAHVQVIVINSLLVWDRIALDSGNLHTCLSIYSNKCVSYRTVTNCWSYRTTNYKKIFGEKLDTLEIWNINFCLPVQFLGSTSEWLQHYTSSVAPHAPSEDFVTHISCHLSAVRLLQWCYYQDQFAFVPVNLIWCFPMKHRLYNGKTRDAVLGKKLFNTHMYFSILHVLIHSTMLA